MIDFKVLRSASELDTVRAEWEVLARRPFASFFQRFSWNRLAAEIFAQREEPHVIVARREPSLVIIPLAMRRDGTATLMGEALFDYRDMLSSGDRALEIAALEYASQLGVGLDITALTPKTVGHWAPLQGQAFCNAPRIVRAFCSPDDLRIAHRRLGRHARRIAAAGITLHRRDGLDREFVAEFYERRAASEESLFTDPLRREFMSRICFAEGERCEIISYETDLGMVAAILSFRSAHARHFYTTYYDTEWAEFSPGQVLLYEKSLETLSDGLDCDFMTGEYAYKTRLAKSNVPLLRLRVSAEDWKRAMASRSAAA